MSRDKRAGWLAEIKVGDVAYMRDAGSGRLYKRLRVRRVTPTGQIVASALGGFECLRFTPSGQEVGGCGRIVQGEDLELRDRILKALEGRPRQLVGLSGVSSARIRGAVRVCEEHAEALEALAEAMDAADAALRGVT